MNGEPEFLNSFGDEPWPSSEGAGNADVPGTSGSGGWLDRLGELSAGAFDAAKKITDLQLLRDNLTANKERRAFERERSSQELQLQRDLGTTRASAARLDAQTALARAQQAFRDASAATPGGTNTLVLVALALGAFLLLRRA